MFLERIDIRNQELRIQCIQKLDQLYKKVGLVRLVVSLNWNITKTTILN